MSAVGRKRALLVRGLRRPDMPADRACLGVARKFELGRLGRGRVAGPVLVHCDLRKAAFAAPKGRTASKPRCTSSAASLRSEPIENRGVRPCCSQRDRAGGRPRRRLGADRRRSDRTLDHDAAARIAPHAGRARRRSCRRRRATVDAPRSVARHRQGCSARSSAHKGSTYRKFPSSSSARRSARRRSSIPLLPPARADLDGGAVAPARRQA